ncbi:hypothetical protein [Deinococcus alpinitundrae]|uniref:hypothetical protein n=1 Tax=Deinococcus alpinitundrae TaxID=468913 RepID=UPI001379B082|nr:hypothetical protein [Deinococcus alpinitundrae]
MTWTENPQLRAMLLARAALAEKAGAEEAAAFLREKLEGAGTGNKWPGLPNTSSAPGEYPAEQSGKLLKSIDAQPMGQFWAFGSFNAPVEAFALEYPAPGRTARPWLSKMLADPDARERVMHAMWEVMRH